MYGSGSFSAERNDNFDKIKCTFYTYLRTNYAKENTFSFKTDYKSNLNVEKTLKILKSNKN